MTTILPFSEPVRKPKIPKLKLIVLYKNNFFAILISIFQVFTFELYDILILRNRNGVMRCARCELLQKYTRKIQRRSTSFGYFELWNQSYEEHTISMMKIIFQIGNRFYTNCNEITKSDNITRVTYMYVHCK